MTSPEPKFPCMYDRKKIQKQLFNKRLISPTLLLLKRYFIYIRCGAIKMDKYRVSCTIYYRSTVERTADCGTKLRLRL